MRSTNPNNCWNLPGPQSEGISVDGAEFMADGSDVVNQPEILNRQILRCRRRKDIEAGERKVSSLLPLMNGCLNLRRPHEVWLIRSGRPIIRHRNVVVRASDLVLGTVATLGEVFIAANVATLACVTPLTRLGVAPSGRTTTGTGHGNGFTNRVNERKELETQTPLVEGSERYAAARRTAKGYTRTKST